MKGTRVGLFMSLVCKASLRGMLADRCICLVFVFVCICIYLYLYLYLFVCRFSVQVSTDVTVVS